MNNISAIANDIDNQAITPPWSARMSISFLWIYPAKEYKPMKDMAEYPKLKSPEEPIKPYIVWRMKKLIKKFL